MFTTVFDKPTNNNNGLILLEFISSVFTSGFTRLSG